MITIYQRIMAWLAGPISIAAGYVAALAVRYLGPLSGIVSKDKIAYTITIAVAFGVGTLVTYLGHQKWFTNLAKYWEIFFPAGGQVKAKQGPK